MDREKIGLGMLTAGLGLATGCSVYGFKDGWGRGLMIGVFVGVAVSVLGVLFAGSAPSKGPEAIDKYRTRQRRIWTTTTAALTVLLLGVLVIGFGSKKDANERKANPALINGNPGPTVEAKPWRLNRDQIADLAKKMRPFASDLKRSDLITPRFWDGPTMKIASDLKTAFMDAGWDLPVTGLSMASKSFAWKQKPYRPGLYILVNPNSQNPPGLSELVGVLKGAGIDPIAEPFDEVPEGVFRIFIDAKPD